VIPVNRQRDHTDKARCISPQHRYADKVHKNWNECGSAVVAVMHCPKSRKRQVLRRLVHREYLWQLARNGIRQTRTNTSTFDLLHHWQQHPDLVLRDSGDWQLKCRGRWSPTPGNDQGRTLDHSRSVGTTKSAPTMKEHLPTPMPFWSSCWRRYVACDDQLTNDKLAHVSHRCRPVHRRRACDVACQGIDPKGDSEKQWGVVETCADSRPSTAFRKSPEGGAVAAIRRARPTCVFAADISSSSCLWTNGNPMLFEYFILLCLEQWRYNELPLEACWNVECVFASLNWRVN